MTIPNDHIPRRAVLEAIDEILKAHHDNCLVALASRIAALPAAPVDSTPAPQPADFGPCVVCGRSVLDPHWGIVHSGCAAQFRNPQPAPQPALDVAGLVAEAEEQLKAWDYKGHLDDWRGSEMRLCALIKKQSDTLTTLAAQLQQERRQAAREHSELLRVRVQRDLAIYARDHNEANTSLRDQRDTLAARLAEVERERDDATRSVARLNNDLVDMKTAVRNLNSQILELERLNNATRRRAETAEQALADAQAALARCPYRHVIDQWLICDNQEGATGNAEADWHRLRVAMWQEWLDPQISEEAAKLIERGRTEALAGLGKVEWEVQSEHDPYPFEPLKEKDRADAIRDGLTIRAIRRVLDAGGAGK